MKCLGEFLRTVLPEDLTQLLLIFGAVCLFISPQLRWGLSLNVPLFTQLGMVEFAPYAIPFAGAAAYFICFRPGSHPVRRLFWWVCFPALAVLVAECCFYIYLAIKANTVASFALVWKLGPGFHFAVVGLVFVAGFTFRVALGSASLPLKLPQGVASGSDGALSWRSLQIVLWILVVWQPLVWCAAFVVFLLMHLQATSKLLQQGLFTALMLTIPFGIFVGLTIWLSGKEAWTALRRAVRLPRPESFLLAIAFPLVTIFLGSLSYYLFERARWALETSEKSSPSQFAAYFGFPAAGIMLSLIFPAFLEEVIFRGLLQPRFIRRYGILRGIFLLCVIFAVWHFGSDFSPQFSDGLVLVQLGLRVLMSVAQGMVLGWLTLRTGSVLPAALAHAIYNSFAKLPSIGWGAGQSALIHLSWGLLAYILFRYWPIKDDSPKERSSVTVAATSD
jgi:membrane protease YdiL (CAAX protease family)